MRFPVLSSISIASRSSELAVGFQAERKAGKHIRRACDFPLFPSRARARRSSLIFYNIKPTSEIVERVIPSPSSSSPSLISLALFFLHYAYHFPLHLSPLPPPLNLRITRPRLICAISYTTLHFVPVRIPF